MANKFKQALHAGMRQIGLWQSLASPYTTEICAGAGYDWLLIDGEHGPNDLRSILAQLQILRPGGPEPVVRPASDDPAGIKQLLDIGARNLLVPMVHSADQARALVAATRYPPAGIRGVAASVTRASRWNRHQSYFQAADDMICLLAQVESRAGLAALRGICAVDGVDGVFIGPADLAADLGYSGNPSHPKMAAIIEQAIRDIRDSGKAAGIIVTDAELGHHYLDIGVTFLAVGVDVLLLARASEDLAAQYGRTRPEEAH
nr:aldolase/citrate lyase family protein [Sphingomonas sp. Y57]